MYNTTFVKFEISNHESTFPFHIFVMDLTSLAETSSWFHLRASVSLVISQTQRRWFSSTFNAVWQILCVYRKLWS